MYRFPIKRQFAISFRAAEGSSPDLQTIPLVWYAYQYMYNPNQNLQCGVYPHNWKKAPSFTSVALIWERPCQLHMIKGSFQAIALNSRIASSKTTSVCLGRIRFDLVLDECPKLLLEFGLRTLL